MTSAELLKLAKQYVTDENFKNAENTYKQIIAEFPDSKEAKTAAFDLKDLVDKGKLHIQYNTNVTDEPSSQDSYNTSQSSDKKNTSFEVTKMLLLAILVLLLFYQVFGDKFTKEEASVTIPDEKKQVTICSSYLISPYNKMECSGDFDGDASISELIKGGWQYGGDFSRAQNFVLIFHK